MRKNEKIKEIERLFEGGPIDLFSLLHFMIEEFENYKVLEFRSNDRFTLEVQHLKSP